MDTLQLADLILILHILMHIYYPHNNNNRYYLKDILLANGIIMYIYNLYVLLY